jgi:hypothetical protein
MRVEDIVCLLAIRKNDDANIQMERNGAMRDGAMEPEWKFRVGQISDQIALYRCEIAGKLLRRSERRKCQ